MSIDIRRAAVPEGAPLPDRPGSQPERASPAEPGHHGRVERAVQAGRAYLLSLQEEQGWWKGELATNVTMDAEDLMMRQFLGVRTRELTEQSARWVRSQQRADGSWATFHDGPGDVSTSVEAYVALRLVGDDRDAAHLQRAREWILAHGGLEDTRVFTRIWLALFGQWSWDELPAMPPELVLLPPWVPLNIYDWGCWARQTVVPLTIVSALRPVRDLGVDVGELRIGPTPGGPTPDARAPERPAPTGRARLWAGAFRTLDRLLHGYEHRPVRWLRRRALARAEAWILARQEADGSWGGIQPPWVYSLIALHLLGHGLDAPAVRDGLAGLEGFTIREPGPGGEVRRLEACQSPVWDTVLAMTALADAGLEPDDPRLVRAADWVLSEEIRVTGDWSVRRPGLAPGGWAFEFDNDGYPDTDDTAEVMLALRRVRRPEALRRPGARAGQDTELGPGQDIELAPGQDTELDAAVVRGRDWLLGMQCRDGGWGAFDADNTRALVTMLPFCDFGSVIDPPSADVTAHIVEALAREGLAKDPAVVEGVRWLLRAQERDGSWFGRWGANYVYGTGAAVPALVAAGVPTDDPVVRRAVAWLEEVQHPDGGWGESMLSYRDPQWSGRGEPTASQTAWALLALLAAGEDSVAVTRGVDFLVRTQREDGGWDEPEFTGTGFPGDFFINYHLYRVVFPLSALGRYLGAAS